MVAVIAARSVVMAWLERDTYCTDIVVKEYCYVIILACTNIIYDA